MSTGEREQSSLYGGQSWCAILQEGRIKYDVTRELQKFYNRFYKFIAKIDKRQITFVYMMY